MSLFSDIKTLKLLDLAQNDLIHLTETEIPTNLVVLNLVENDKLSYD